jgi:hypothetical protein
VPAVEPLLPLPPLPLQLLLLLQLLLAAVSAAVLRPCLGQGLPPLPGC